MTRPPQLTEAEARAVGHLMWRAVIFARRSTAEWMDRKPRKDEVLQVVAWLARAEEVVMNLSQTPPDKRKLDELRGVIFHLNEMLKEMGHE
jgi:hypothetical protein